MIFRVFRGILFLCVLTLSYSLNAKDTITLEPGTPIFQKPLKKIIKVTSKKEKYRISGRITEKSNKFPLLKCLYFYKINIAETPHKTAYAAPDLVVKFGRHPVSGKRQATVDLRSRVNWTLLFSSIICGFCLFYFLYFHYFKGKYKPLLSTIVFCVFLFFLRWIILSFTHTYPIRIFCSPTDEHYYLQGAVDIINFNFSSPMKVSIGTPLYYLPFCLLYGQEDIFPVIMQISKFNGYILMPLISIMLFFIALKITRSYPKSIIYILIFSILPIFYHYFEGWDILLFKSGFGLPDFDGYRFYKQYISLGFNNLPDVPSTFIIISFVLYAFYGRKNIFYIILISALFAFSCLIRLNNILFAPSVALCFWFKFKTDYQEKPILLIKHIFISLICFLSIFSIQLYLNHLCNGSILNTGYGNNNTNAIFNTIFMNASIRSVIGCNYIFMVMGCCGIIFQTDARKRILLAFWSIPMIIFLCGTNAASVTPYRYLLAVLPFFIVAFFDLPVWTSLKKQEKILVLASIISSFILVSPSGMAPFSGSLPLDLSLAKNGKAITVILYLMTMAFNLIALFLIRKNRKAFVFLAFSLLLFFIGNQFLIFAIFIAIILWALVDVYKVIKPEFKTLFGRKTCC